MILLSLLTVVVDEFADAGLSECDLGDDFVGCGGPDEELRVGVPSGRRSRGSV